MIFLLIGILLYLAVVSDIIQTTLSMQGGGWITTRLAHYLWNGFLLLAGRDGNKKFLSHCGYILLGIILITWVVLLWGSFSLMLLSVTDSVVNAQTKLPADIWNKFYFAGFNIATLGLGDYVPGNDWWKFVTNVYAFTGLILLTMSVTYLVPVLSAVIEQRKLAIKLESLGPDAGTILADLLQEKTYVMNHKLDEISDSLIKHTQNHRAYPIIHYFHSYKPEKAIVLQLAKLFEVYYLIKFHLKAEWQPAKIHISSLQDSFVNYTNIVRDVTHMNLIEELPEAFTYKELGTKYYQLEKPNPETLEAINERRKVFNSLVIQDGWKPKTN